MAYQNRRLPLWLMDLLPGWLPGQWYWYWFRPVTPDDVPNLPAMKLEDFDVDFSGVKPPPEGELDEAALHAYADALCEACGVKVGRA